MRTWLAIQRVDQNRARSDYQDEYTDGIERAAAERAAQQCAHAARVVKFSGTNRYRSLTHVFSP